MNEWLVFSSANNKPPSRPRTDPVANRRILNFPTPPRIQFRVAPILKAKADRDPPCRENMLGTHRWDVGSLFNKRKEYELKIREEIS